MTLDATTIVPRLWQSGLPPQGRIVADHGFHALVLCACELQLPAESFPGVDVLFCPLLDALTPLPAEDAEAALATAALLAERFRGGQKLLVSCFAGINRSGLVSALTVRAITGCTGKQARRMVQSKVEGALSNAVFWAFLDGLPAP